jgi:hypothetical protein
MSSLRFHSRLAFYFNLTEFEEMADSFDIMTSKEKSDISEPWFIRVLQWRITYVGMAVILLALDYATGDLIQFPIAFVIPVALASWFISSGIGYRLALVMPCVRFGFGFFWHTPLAIHMVVNVLIRIAVLLFIAFLTSKAARLTREVKMLQGILPMCSFCKKIRDKNDDWQPIETFISRRTEANVTHGICPECTKLHFGEILNQPGAHS